MAIAACKKAGKYVGICGQAPSDFPEITKFLVEQGVSTISVNPDSVVQMAHVISEMENKAK
jgi:pyruvate,water dikinase